LLLRSGCGFLFRLVGPEGEDRGKAVQLAACCQFLSGFAQVALWSGRRLMMW
jgi:hypothetical protein